MLYLGISEPVELSWMGQKCRGRIPDIRNYADKAFYFRHPK